MRFPLAVTISLSVLGISVPAAADYTGSQLGVELDIQISGERGSLDDSAIRGWVRSTAEMAGNYCSQFPVPALRVEVELRSGNRVFSGHHYSGRRVRIRVGRDASVPALARDFILLHELLHTAFPSLARRHRWLREGLSTYLELMVRAQAGVISEEEVWRRWTGSMHNGLPRDGDRGLDRTPTWGRVYWGGALFWLVVDVDLRRYTSGRENIQTLVQGVVASGGNSRVRWPITRLLWMADSVTGTRVMSRAYQRMALSPRAPDLHDFFRRLGVQRDRDTVHLSDRAPLSQVRRQMTRPN